MKVSRRSFLAGGAAAFAGLLTPGWLEEIAFAKKPAPYLRYNVNTTQGQSMLTKLGNAIETMRSTSSYPVCDPHSYTFQWYTHWTEEDQAFQYTQSTEFKESQIAKYCSGQDAALAEAMWNGCQAHGIDNDNPDHYQEWFFPPWHRAYLYYFEQIVRNVLGDGDFSLPYWNPASGNVSDLSIPAAFRDTASPLYDSSRYAPINNGKRIDNVVIAPNWITANCLREPIYIDSPTGGFGFCPQVDINPHFLVHIGMGGHMSDGFNTVVEDPIFWVHHANIDRLWESWNRLNSRTNPASPKWSGRVFTWADANGNQVNLPVSGTRRVAQLGYTYDSYTLPPRVKKNSDPPGMAAVSSMPPVMVASASGGPLLAPGSSMIPLGAAVAEGERNPMPLARRVEQLAPGRQIYLVLKGLHANPVSAAAYGVYVDLPKGAQPISGNDPHFAGALPILRGHAHGKQVALNLTETLQRLHENGMLARNGNSISIIPNRVSPAVAGPDQDLFCGTPGTALVEQVALIER